MSRTEATRIAIPGIAIPVIVFLLYMLVPGVREKPWTGTRSAGAVIAIAGYLLVCVARIQLGESFTVGPQARKLVTHGLYSRVRNPIYVFVDLMVAGLILVFQVRWFFAVLAVVVAGQIVQSRREARVLEQKFGQEYVDYRRQTWF